jgi:hypothetical protein
MILFLLLYKFSLAVAGEFYKDMFQHGEMDGSSRPRKAMEGLRQLKIKNKYFRIILLLFSLSACKEN